MILRPIPVKEISFKRGLLQLFLDCKIFIFILKGSLRGLSLIKPNRPQSDEHLTANA